MARQIFEQGEAVKVYRYSGGRFGPDTWDDRIVADPDVVKGTGTSYDPTLHYVRVTPIDPKDEWQRRGTEVKNARNLIRKASDFADIQAEIDRKAAQYKQRGDEAMARSRLRDAAPDLLAALKRAVNCIDPIRIKDADGRGPMTPIEEATVEQARAAIEKAEGS